MLKIYDDGQQLDHKVSGAVIKYTKLGWGELREIREECRDPETLRIEEGAVEEEILRRHVHGWDEKVVDANGAPLPFSFDALLHFPPIEIDTLIFVICAAVREEEKAQGEFESSSTT
jgi:hypothetical protein